MIRGTEESGQLLGGALVATALFGIPALYLPTWRSLRITAFALFGVQMLLMWMFIRRFNRGAPPTDTHLPPTAK